MAARWMDDAGWRNDDEDPPRLGRRAARRARAARVEDMTEEDEEYVAALDDVFTDAEFERLFGNLRLGRAEFEQRFNDLQVAPAPPPAPRPREPAAARLDRQDSGDSVARAAARHAHERAWSGHQPAVRVRGANSELRRLHELNGAQEPERPNAWPPAASYYEQPAECAVCLQNKPLRRFALHVPCGHGTCRKCVRQTRVHRPNESHRCHHCRRPIDSYEDATDWRTRAELDRLLRTRAAMNPYTI